MHIFCWSRTVGIKKATFIVPFVKATIASAATDSISQLVRKIQSDAEPERRHKVTVPLQSAKP